MDTHHHHHEPKGVSDSVLLWAIVVNLGLSVFEFLAGIVAGSVALMADALHNTNDAAALLIAYIARKISRRKADYNFTFGYRRAELIGAMIQLTALIVVGLYLVYEAVHRIFAPEPIAGKWMMAAAGVALLVDVVTALLLWSMSRGSMNVRAAFLHNLTDAGASVAVLLGGAMVFWLNWTWIDPVLTLLIAGYVLLMSYNMLKRTSHILMQGAPPDLDLDELRNAIEAIDGVENLHHLHVWEMDEQRRSLEAHVVVMRSNLTAQSDIKRRIKSVIEHRFNITHSTLEFESDDTCAHEDGNLIARH